MVACPACGTELGADPGGYCRACGAKISSDLPLGTTAPAPPDRAAHLCPSCRTPLTRAGDLGFRVGGYTGGAGMFLGNWNQLAEKLQPFSVYHCPACGRIDLFELGK